MVGHTISLHRVFACKPELLFRAFTEPGAVAKWISPNGFYCTVHEHDVRVGGKHSASFTNLASGDTHSFGGEYLEVIPNELLRYTDRFDDPNLPGEMMITVRLTAVSVGTDLRITQEHVPTVIPPEACFLGWQQTLENLMRLVQ